MLVLNINLTEIVLMKSVDYFDMKYEDIWHSYQHPWWNREHVIIILKHHIFLDIDIHQMHNDMQNRKSDMSNVWRKWIVNCQRKSNLYMNAKQVLWLEMIIRVKRPSWMWCNLLDKVLIWAVILCHILWMSCTLCAVVPYGPFFILYAIFS